MLRSYTDDLGNAEALQQLLQKEAKMDSRSAKAAAKLAIAGGPAAALVCRDHHITAVHSEPKEFFSYMEFESMQLARQLFDGQVNAIAAVGLGQVRIGGMIAQIDNINRILDRVAIYLA